MGKNPKNKNQSSHRVPTKVGRNYKTRTSAFGPKAIRCLRWAKALLAVSLTIPILFLISLIVQLPGFVSGNYALAIIVYSFFWGGIPLIIGFVLAIIAAILFHLLKKRQIAIPSRIKLLKIIALLQIPIVAILIVIASFTVWEINAWTNRLAISSKVSEIYGDDATIINTYFLDDPFSACFGCPGGGPDGHTVVAFSLDGFDYPILGEITDSHHPERYVDNFADLKRADDLNYQSFIKQLFGPNVFLSLMEVGNPKLSYRTDNNNVYLGMLLSESELDDPLALQAKILQLTNEYAPLAGKGDFELIIYFMKDFNPSLLQDYYISINRGHYYYQKTSRVHLPIQYFIIDPSGESSLEERQQSIEFRIKELVQKYPYNTRVNATD